MATQLVGHYSQSTTEPNTPEPLSIDEEDEETPRGDFARLIPISKSACHAFHSLVLATEKSPQKYDWHRRFMYIRPDLREMGAEVEEHSTSDELLPSSESQSPTMIHTGFWRLNMDLQPLNRHFGWILGKGRWSASGDHSDTATGGVDILLTANTREPVLRGRHARLLHSMDSYTLMIAADKKLRLGDRYLEQTSVSALGHRTTVIAIGDLEYKLVFTDLDQSVYRSQLDQLSHFMQYQGQRPGAFVDPTPLETDYLIMDKYFIRSSFSKGSTCWMCAAVNRDTGASVAVKKIVATTVGILNLAQREVKAMKRLLSSHSPPSIAKLVDSLFIQPSKSSGATECFIISQPLISQTLGQLLSTCPSLPLNTRVSLLQNMLEGLAFLHGEGCMHRDIKPENILASVSPVQAVIIDFGCATWARTSRDHMQGTIPYLAPEVIALKMETAPPNTTYDISSDVWSMGLTAHELMRGSRIRFDKISRKFYDDALLPSIGFGPLYLEEDSIDWVSGLIREMLQWNPRSRIKAEQAYRRCPGFQNDGEQRQLQHGKREHEDELTRRSKT